MSGNYILKFLLLGPILSLTLGNNFNFLLNSVAAQAAKNHKSKSRKYFIPPKPPKDLSAPGKRSSAGSRIPGESRPLSEQIVAIVPEYEKIKDYIPLPQVWVLTASPHPKFWFYVPASSQKCLNFSLENRSNVENKYTTIYQEKVHISNPGFVSVSLPSYLTTLKAGLPYRWSFGYPCSDLSADEFQHDFVQGWVEYKPLSSTIEELVNIGDIKKSIETYNQNGIWLDSLSILMTAYQKSPSQYSSYWKQMLSSIDLQELEFQGFSN